MITEELYQSVKFSMLQPEFLQRVHSRTVDDKPPIQVTLAFVLPGHTPTDLNWTRRLPGYVLHHEGQDVGMVVYPENSLPVLAVRHGATWEQLDYQIPRRESPKEESVLATILRDGTIASATAIQLSEKLRLAKFAKSLELTYHEEGFLPPFLPQESIALATCRYPCSVGLLQQPAEYVMEYQQLSELWLQDMCHAIAVQVNAAPQLWTHLSGPKCTADFEHGQYYVHWWVLLSR